MEITDQSFNIVDIKPANMEELQEVGSNHLFYLKLYILNQNSTQTMGYQWPFCLFLVYETKN